MRPPTFKATGLLVGMIIGAGMFALPYAVKQAGLFWSLIHFLFAASLITAVHLLFGSVLYHNNTHHRLPGYVKEFLGKDWYFLSLFARFFSYFGTLLAYGVLAGLFISYIVPDAPEKTVGIIFFLILSVFLFLGLKKASAVNLSLTIPLILFIALFFMALMPSFDFSRVNFFPENGNWFLPYGVFLFAFSGASVIPEIADLFRHHNKRLFKKSIIAATVIVAVVYIIFVASILGVSGGDVSEFALSSLARSVPEWLIAVGVFIGLLAVITSYLALGIELRFTFEQDISLNRLDAWALTAFVPLILYLFGINNFVTILGIIGAVGIGVEGLLISLLAHKTVHTSSFAVFILSVCFIFGALLEGANVIGLI